MSKYLIKGGKPLRGTVQISGNKNSILPCLSASLLTDQEVTLKNVPSISDVEVFIKILERIGAKVERSGDEIRVTAKNITNSKLPKELVNKLRASILFVGPLLSRLGEVYFSHPGGDIIGKRSIEAHIEGFKELGVEFDCDDRDYKGFKKETKEKVEIYLDEASVTATENLILGSVLGKCEVTIKNAAKEPHVLDLCNLLLGMGGQITGVGSSTLLIKGVPKLGGTTFTVGADFIEMGTYVVASVITQGDIRLKNCSLLGLEPIFKPFQKMGVKVLEEDGEVRVECSRLLALSKLHTNIWPGFPTDLMSVFIVLSTQALGVTLAHDWMFESRMFFTDKLINMGAQITICDPHRVLVYGPSSLIGRELETPDIRAGMALLLAALIAKGESTINKAELIERGYAGVVSNLKKLGADIQAS